MGFYKKTVERINNTIASTDRENINDTFTSFFKQYHSENISFAGQRAYSLFGCQISKEMVEDVVNDLYFQMLIMEEEDLKRMEETDLIRIFRGMVNSPAFVGAMHQQVKYSNNLDIDDLDF